MINIIDRYEQIRFGAMIDGFRYVGTCNFSNNVITNIEVTIYTSEDIFVGNMSTRDGIGISVSLNDTKALESLKGHSEILNSFKIELEKLLLTKDEL